MQESIVFLVRVQCRRKESSRSLSHLLMSFLYNYIIILFLRYSIAGEKTHRGGGESQKRKCDRGKIAWKS